MNQIVPERVLIPAKGTSHRIARKNLQVISQGKSLLQWTIENYRRWFPTAAIHVATDDLEIELIATELHCHIYRLTDDDSADRRTVSDLLREFLSRYPERPLLLAQCTSPITFFSDVYAALESRRPISVSGYFATLHTARTGEALSQDIPLTPCITGNFAIVNTAHFPVDVRGRTELIAPVKWLSQIDIDTHEDLEQARLVAVATTQDVLDRF